MTRKYADGLPLARQEKDLGKAGRGTQPCYTGKLGHSVYSDLVEAAVPAHEAETSGRASHSCGRDRGAGAERRWKISHLPVPNVAVCHMKDSLTHDGQLEGVVVNGLSPASEVVHYGEYDCNKVLHFSIPFFSYSARQQKRCP